MIKQVQAVINAVSEVLGDSFTESQTIASDVLSKDQKSEVRELVFNGILNGEVEYGKPTTDEKTVYKYVRGMVDNHLRKSKKLNGGNTYKPSSSGSRRDPQLRELNKLLTTLDESSEDFAKVQAHIQERTAEIAEEKSAKQAASAKSKIDTSVLPPNLAELIS